MNYTFERFQWVTTPDGKMILVDTWTSKVVEGAPVYSNSNTSTGTNIGEKK